ncbi:MAG: hypothetical protein WCV50_05370 [Patescibacteria group bacterium]
MEKSNQPAKAPTNSKYLARLYLFSSTSDFLGGKPYAYGTFVMSGAPNKSSYLPAKFGKGGSLALTLSIFQVIVGLVTDDEGEEHLLPKICCTVKEFDHVGWNSKQAHASLREKFMSSIPETPGWSMGKPPEWKW